MPHYYYDFTVSLQGVLPRPWRRFLVSERSSFAVLHSAIQDACGWTDSHLHEFRGLGSADGDAIAGTKLDDDPLGPVRQVPDSRKKQIRSYFGGGPFTTCLYVYDFGDDWHHDLQLNDVVTLPAKFKRRLLGGEHAFPPDDCGGPYAYVAIQQALSTGKDPEGLLAWARETWDWTGMFDLDKVRAAFDRGG